MPKNIEMSVLGSDGTYDVLYPKNISDIVLSSEYLKGVFNLSDNSDIDDAFDYINRKIILLQYNKAGINVTLKSVGGSPLEGIPINGITANYDGTGSCVTDSEGKCFGYCDAGSVTVSTNKYVDMTVNSQQLNVLASEMYNVELTASNFVNFKKFTSSSNVIFSINVLSVDVCCVGGGGGGSVERNSAAGGGGGYVSIQNSVSFDIDKSYSLIVGAGGNGGNNGVGGNKEGTNGGSSSFLNLSATGGKGGVSTDENSGKGNGNGGRVDYINYSLRVREPTEGTQQGFYSFTENGLYGGGGGGAYYDIRDDISGQTSTKTTYGGGYQGNKNGTNGFAGGGAGYPGTTGSDRGGKGGSGCVAIRIHLKVMA